MQNKLQPRLASTGVLRIGKNREDGGGGRGGLRQEGGWKLRVKTIQEMNK